MLFQLPRECRTYAALNPAAQWGWSEILANRTNFLLEMIIWQNSTPHKKALQQQHKQQKPKPYVPEFMKPPQPPAEINKEVAAMTVSDIDSWLKAPRGV